MIELTKGNLLNAPAEALVNTVNTVGIMGKGVALQFKMAYPEMFRAYQRACEAGEVKLGKVQVFDLGGLAGGPRWVINFPTKAHWRAKSRLADIETGLRDLVAIVNHLKIGSIAIPPLGCGLGGLNWADVRPRIESAFSSFPGVRVMLFAPGEDPHPASMPNRTDRPVMSLGRAALISLMDRYLKGLLDPFVRLLEIHKLMYFLQEAGQPLNLRFVAGKQGPYALNLRQVLIQMEKHYTVGYGAGGDNPAKPIELLPGAVEAAEKFLAGDNSIRQRMDRVTELIAGFEDSYGLELLSSVHWVMCERAEARESADAAIRAVHRWSHRKKSLLKDEHLQKAWQRLIEKGWALDRKAA